MTEKRYEILDSLPTNGPMYISIPEGYYSQGYAVRFYREDHTDWVANFKPGVSKFNYVHELPNNNLIIIAGGTCYIINPEETQPVSKFGGEYGGLLLSSDGRIVLPGSTCITILETNGADWDSERISWDGLKDLKIEGSIVTGLSFDPMYDRDVWVKFTYDIDTKTLVGGSYTYSTYYRRNEKSAGGFSKVLTKLIKKIFALILLIGFLYSCNNGNNSTYKAPDFKTFDTAVYFSGFYVCEDYINALKKYKSPKLVEGKGISISIPGRTLKYVNMGYNFHEGVGYDVVKRGNKYQLFTAPSNDSIKNTDTNSEHVLAITIISQNRIEVSNKDFGDKYFDKLDSSNGVVEQLLFNGTYQSDSGKTVKFSAGGKVSGLGSYKSYSVMIDYNDEARDIDQVLLGTNEKDQKEYGFKFKKDTLLIYELKCLEYDKDNHMCGSVGFGKLKYTLVKR